MTNLAHIAETAMLLLAAYLGGCILGYAVRLALHAGRGTRQVTPPIAVAAPAPEPRKPRSSAARLAARVDTSPPDPSPTKVADLAQKPVSATAAIPAASKPRPTGPKPVTLEQPRAGGPDNLKQIKGIGPKIEASLYAMGTFHIDQIAGWNKANVEWVDAQLSFRGRIRRERWVEQAQQLASTRTVA